MRNNRSDFASRSKRFNFMFNGILTFIALFIVGMFSFYVYLGLAVAEEVEENGGVKETIIHIGKEIKDINRQIDED